MKNEEWKKLIASLAMLLVWAGCFAQQSATAKRMAQQGLVDILSVDSTIQVSLMYSRPDNFTGKVLYTDLREAYLHPKAATAVAKAQQALKKLRPELSLKIYDATRPMSVQQKMWNVVAGTGDTLDMGTQVDFLGPYAHIDDEAGLVAKHIITSEAKKNRELLRKVMKEAGFIPLKTEWWHFNLVSRAEAKAHYKAIK